MPETTEGGLTALSGPYNAAPYRSGMRGRVLKAWVSGQGVGQDHLARQLGQPQPLVSMLLAEKAGGLPRGYSGRVQTATAAIVASDAGECYKGCGCVLCPGCGHRASMAYEAERDSAGRLVRWCGGHGCARLFETTGKARP